MFDVARAAPSSTVDRPSRPGIDVAVAPYAMIRLAAVVLASDPPATARLRELTAAAIACLRTADGLSGTVEQLLHARAATVDPDVRGAVLALRRDVHNARTPRAPVRAGVLEVLADVGPLRDWLAARDDLDRLDGELRAASIAALADERAQLARACCSEPLRRAVALTGDDLLRAVDRAAACGSVPDKRARKSEATVLRYVLRAATKTSPLSWFTYAAFARWDATTSDLDHDLPVVAVSQPDRGAVEALVSAALTCTDSAATRFQLQPGARVHPDRVLFRRAAAVGEYGAVIQREEELSLRRTPVLDLVLAACTAGSVVRLEQLAADIAGRLPVPPSAALPAAERYVRDLVAQGLLRPVAVTDPQSPQAIVHAVELLSTSGQEEAARLLGDLDELSTRFAAAPASDRAARVHDLRTRWDDAFRAVGVEPSARRMPVTEDVTVAGELRLGDRMGRAARESVALLAPLFEIFDLFTVVRRAARDRFVARYGEGGECSSIAQFAVDYADVWRDVDLVGPGGIASATHSLGRGLDELAHVRRRLALLAAQAQPVEGVVELPHRVVDDARRLLPDWAAARPASYSVFAQPDASRLCVNRVYGGWGRFTSRFLTAFDPSAAALVAAQVREYAGTDAIAAQIRPVGGFNANLHPLLLDTEVAEQPRAGVIHPSALHLVHDVATDQLRLRHPASGRFVDLLYLGFLVPVALPERLVPLLNDLGSGLVDVVSPLRPAGTRTTRLGTIGERPRLVYRDVVLGRRQWRLDAATVERWGRDLSADPDAAMAVVARWRAELGLPCAVFVAGATGEHAADLTALQDYVDSAKPQYLDLGAALHVRCLPRTFARYPRGIVMEEALPAPEPGRRCVEVMLETYRRPA